jgi:hypothetical protein
VEFHSKEYDITDTGGVELLLQACEALDKAEALSEQIHRDGVVVRNTRGIRPHSCLKIELAHRQFIVRTLVRLGLTEQSIKNVGRPPGTFNYGADD